MSSTNRTRSSARLSKSDVNFLLPTVVNEEFIAHNEQDVKNGLSDYEMIRLENIRRNEQFLSQLGIMNVKASFDASNPSSDLKKKINSNNRKGATKTVKPSKDSKLIRRSSRVTIEKLKVELEQLKNSFTKSSNGENDVTITDAINQKEVLLQEMLSKKLENNSYEDIINNTNPSEYYMTRLASDPIPLSLLTNLKQLSDSQDHTSNNYSDYVASLLETSLPTTKSKASSYSNDKKRSYSTIIDSDSNHSYKSTNNLAKYEISDGDVAKVTESRITAIFLHPSGDKIVVMAGDKDGYFGIWDVQSDGNDKSNNQLDGIYKYKPHVSNIAKIFASQTNPSKIFTVSYDGTIRSIDTQSKSFICEFEAPENLSDVYFTDCSFVNNLIDSAFISKSNGNISLVDFRINNKSSYSWDYNINDNDVCKLNSIQQHPSQENIVVVGGSGKNGSIMIFDIRKANKNWKPLNKLTNHTKSINAAYISPNGEYLVSVSLDDTIKTFSQFTDPTVPSSLYCDSMRHNNFTGRWLSTFRPAFNPRQRLKGEMEFVLGSMNHPRQIELFRPNTGNFDSTASFSKGKTFRLEVYATIQSENLNSVCSRNCFHPVLDVIAAGNSSGRVHILKEKIKSK
eukprot:gene4761-6676_t